MPAPLMRTAAKAMRVPLIARPAKQMPPSLASNNPRPSGEFHRPEMQLQLNCN